MAGFANTSVVLIPFNLFELPMTHGDPESNHLWGVRLKEPRDTVR